MLKAVFSRKDLSMLSEYYNCVSDLLDDTQVQKLNSFAHHICTTRFQHSLNVSYYNFLLCRKLHLNARSAARAGLLHDFFFYDRKTHEKIRNRHCAEHANIALYNASVSFPITQLEGDMIVNHMWPMTAGLPHYAETFIITLVDKFCAAAEVLTGTWFYTGAKCRTILSCAIMALIMFKTK